MNEIRGSLYVRESSREVDPTPWQVVARFACEADARQYADTPSTEAAARALGTLSTAVEGGSVRLTRYPSELPSLPELVAAIEAIETAPALTHDQLARFSELAHAASIGAYRDGMGACARLTIEAAPYTPGLGAVRCAIVKADGETVARISPEGKVL